MSIGGKLDANALAMLHKPTAPELLAREAQRLIGDGLSIPDVASALRLSSAAVADLLTFNLED